ncbi:MAG: DUF448 domain-containing protein [Hyphomonadaceae bacterium JAD_PAG50586_4]|nr:MAG: DUF448 domain-containing protein [Hyphomonadaceae bacterium JAD_PAG50586_4]
MISPTSSANDEGRRGRERRCVASGETYPDSALIRFARAPDGVVTPDVASKLPGRGVWVRADRESVELAARKGGFARGFKEQVKVPGGWPIWSKRCLQSAAWISLVSSAAPARSL